MQLGTGMLAQMTDIRTPGSAPEPGPRAAASGGGGAAQAAPEHQLTDSQQYLKKEEEELFDAIKERARKRKEDEALQKRLNPRKPLQLGPNQTIAQLELSPDQKYVIAQVGDTGTGARPTAVPEYVTESGYTENIPGRTNVGDAQPKTRIAIIASHSGEVKWLDHGLKAPVPVHPPAEKTDAKPDASDARPAADGEQATANPTSEGAAAAGKQEESRNARVGARPPQVVEREIRLSEPIWSEDGAKAVLMGRAADNKDRWIFALDPGAGKARVIATDHDDAWVDGPGSQTLGWMADGQNIYFQSERDGYSHLYAADYATGETRQRGVARRAPSVCNGGVRRAKRQAHFLAR
jgi:hypothetical protein